MAAHRKRNRGECTACKEVFPRTAEFFHPHHNPIDGLAFRCKPCARGRVRENSLKGRREMIAAYGGRCVCCGESEEKFLCIDHVYGRGDSEKYSDAHRYKHVGGRQPGKFKALRPIWAQLKADGFPQDGRFVLNCHNCNMAKGFYGACPHAETGALSPASQGKWYDDYIAGKEDNPDWLNN